MPEPLSEQNLAQLSELIFAGRKIEAIKVYREMAGCGLKEAKERVEELEASLRQTAPEKFTTKSGRGCLGSSAALVVAAVGVAGWLVQR